MPNKKNKVKYGLKNVYYAKATFDDENNVTYGTPSGFWVQSACRWTTMRSSSRGMRTIWCM